MGYGIARSMAPSGLKKALPFFVVELALRDDDAVRSNPPTRGQQWPLQQCFVLELVEQSVEVPKVRYQDGIQQRIAERVVEVPKVSCQECFEAVKDVPQERISADRDFEPRPAVAAHSGADTKLSFRNGFWRRTVHRLRSRVNECNS